MKEGERCSYPCRPSIFRQASCLSVCLHILSYLFAVLSLNPWASSSRRFSFLQQIAAVLTNTLSPQLTLEDERKKEPIIFRPSSLPFFLLHSFHSSLFFVFFVFFLPPFSSLSHPLRLNRTLWPTDRHRQTNRQQPPGGTTVAPHPFFLFSHGRYRQDTERPGEEELAR